MVEGLQNFLLNIRLNKLLVSYRLLYFVFIQQSLLWMFNLGGNE